MNKVLELVNSADMIVDGYSYVKENEIIKVCNLHNPIKSCVLNKDGKMIETTMDDIEVSIVQKYYFNNKEFLEV